MKKLLSIIIASLLMVSMAGCTNEEADTSSKQSTASKQEESSKEDEQPKEKVELTIAIEATGDIPVAFQEQIDRFNETNELGEVSILTYAGAEAYETAIMGQIAGQSAPDIIWLDGGKKIQEYAENEVIIPLNDLMGDITANFEPSLIEAFTVNDVLYGIPKDYNTSVLFYHKDMLAKKSLEIPATIEDFEKATQELTEGEVYGFGCDPKLNYLYPFMATMGANFISETGEIDVEKLNSAEHETALEFFKKMFDDKKATTPYLAGAGWDGELFGNNMVAMMYAGSWVTGVIEDTTKAGVAPLPVKGDASSMLYTAGWAITEQCENQEVATNLIKFLSSDEELVAGNQSGLIGLPPTVTAMNKLIEVKQDDPFLPIYNEVVKDGIAFGLIDSKFVDAYNKSLENMLYSDTSVEETVKVIVSAAE